MNATTTSITLNEPNWLLAKYIRHNPAILLDPDIEAAAVRKAIAEAGPLRTGQSVTLTLTESSAEWLVETLRGWVAQDTERDGAFAISLFCDRIENALDELP